ncbi:MAG: 50S ribosomal protein L22 [Patescibacteria group bacterium]
MEVIAKVRRLRMSPRKVRLVADMVRGLDVTVAEAQLTFLNKAAARPVLKLIRSAKANAEHNFKLTGDGLYIKTIMVDGGPTLHRWMPRAFGRATPIRKRTSHITVILDERMIEGAPKEIAKAVVKKSTGTAKKESAVDSSEPKKSTEKKEVKKAEIEKPAAKKAPVKKAEAKSTKPVAKKDSGKSKKSSA